MDNTLEESLTANFLLLISQLSNLDGEQQIIANFVNGINVLQKSVRLSLEKQDHDCDCDCDNLSIEITTRKNYFGNIYLTKSDASHDTIVNIKIAVNLLAIVLENKRFSHQLQQTENNITPVLHKPTTTLDKISLTLQREIAERKKNQQSLANAQRIAHLGNWDYYIETDELYWSDEIYRIFGLTPQQFGATYEAFLNTVHPDDLEFVKQSNYSAMYKQQPYSIDHRIILPSGEIRYVHEQAQVIYNEQQEPVYMAGTVQDITERKLVEKALKRSEADLARAQNIAKIGSWHWDFTAKSFTWSDTAYQIFNLCKARFDVTSEDRLMKRLHPNDRQLLTKAKEIAIKHKTLQPAEYRFILPDRSMRFVWAEGDINFDQNGNAIGMFGTVQDITERKNVESTLKALAQGTTNREINNFYQECVINLWTLYGAKYSFIGILNETDPKFMKTLAVCDRGKIVDNFEYETTTSHCMQVIEHAKEFSTNSEKFQLISDPQINRSDISYYYGVPLMNAGKQVIGIVVIMDPCNISIQSWVKPILGIFATRIATEIDRFRAIEEIKNHKNQLEIIVEKRTRELCHVNKELESFSYSISHDLRSSLRTINGFSQILIEDYKEIIDKDGLDCLSRLQNASRQMNDLVDNLLKLSRVNQATLQPESVDLANIATEIIEALQFAEPNRPVKVKISPGIMVNADQVLMRCLLQNLIGNAWKYTSRKTDAEIEFGQQFDNGKSVFFVRDNGVGFDMKYANKLFTSFQRLHPASEFEGSGIGLATVKRIIQRHKGTIWAQAKPNKGATFYFNI